MRLLILEKQQNTVAAACSARGICDVLEFLRQAPPNMAAHAKGMRAFFVRYAQGGRATLTTEMFHEANKKEGIWEFRKGRLRIFCFMDGGRLVIATHGAIKKTQKSDPQEIARAIDMKQRYFMAKANGHIEIEEERAP